MLVVEVRHRHGEGVAIGRVLHGEPLHGLDFPCAGCARPTPPRWPAPARCSRPRTAAPPLGDVGAATRPVLAPWPAGDVLRLAQLVGLATATVLVFDDAHFVDRHDAGVDGRDVRLPPGGDVAPHQRVAVELDEKARRIQHELIVDAELPEREPRAERVGDELLPPGVRCSRTSRGRASRACAAAGPASARCRRRRTSETAASGSLPGSCPRRRTSPLLEHLRQPPVARGRDERPRHAFRGVVVEPWSARVITPELSVPRPNTRAA